MDCQSCGMPMAQDSDHGGGRADNPYCKYCTDPAGNLKTKEEVREGMINFQMQQSPGKTREEVATEVDQHMSTMPVWQTPVSEPAAPTPPTTGAGPTGTAPTETPATETPTEVPPASAPPAEEEQV